MTTTPPLGPSLDGPKEPSLQLPPVGEQGEATEAQVLAYLKAHPDFWTQQPIAFSELLIAHDPSGSVSSLLERQILVLRERVKALESRLTEMVHHAQENDAIADRLMRWLRQLLLADDVLARADGLADGLAAAFQLPQVSLRIWTDRPDAQGRAWRLESTQASGLRQLLQGQLRPICLLNQADQAGLVFSELIVPAEAQGSMALLPLRAGVAPQAFGALVLTSPDAGRFSPELGTAFLERIAEFASAALSELGRGPGDIPADR